MYQFAMFPDRADFAEIALDPEVDDFLDAFQSLDIYELHDAWDMLLAVHRLLEGCYNSPRASGDLADFIKQLLEQSDGRLGVIVDRARAMRPGCDEVDAWRSILYGWLSVVGRDHEVEAELARSMSPTLSNQSCAACSEIRAR